MTEKQKDLCMYRLAQAGETIKSAASCEEATEQLTSAEKILKDVRQYLKKNGLVLAE